MQILGQTLFILLWVFIGFLWIRFIADWVQVFARQWEPRGPLLVGLEGVYTASSVEEALAQRARLTHGEIIVTREGHAVSQHAVAFYAPDSEQAGMLARAQEIENLSHQQRAQALIADDSKSASVRLEAAYTDASQRLHSARREAAEAQTRAHTLHVELQRRLVGVAGVRRLPALDPGVVGIRQAKHFRVGRRKAETR